jgi:hypothetical protein
MRRFLIAASLLAVATAVPNFAFAASVTIDGQPVSGAVSKDGHLMVPFRAPLEAIGATVAWDDATSVASASYNNAQLVTVTIGSTEATVTGTSKDLSVAPVLENHLAYIPVEMLGDISHAKVAYSADRTSATVTDWDLAGVNDIGATGNTKIFFWLWVWILVVGGFSYLIAAAAVSRLHSARA